MIFVKPIRLRMCFNSNSDDGQFIRTKKMFEALVRSQTGLDSDYTRIQGSYINHVRVNKHEKLYHYLSDTIVVMHEGSEKASALLHALQGKLCDVNPNVIKQLHHCAPKTFSAKVADFNDNLFYDMQDKGGLKSIFGSSTYEVNDFIEEGIEEFEMTLKAAMGSSSLEYQGSFMKTESTIPQPAHVDFQWDLLNELKGDLFIGFFPLTKDGMFLQVWENGEQEEIPGHIIYIPFGKLVVVPSNTIHGGGFKYGDEGNLRFHLYIASKEKGLPRFQTNRYTEENDKSKELCERFVDSPRLHYLIDSFFM